MADDPMLLAIVQQALWLVPAALVGGVVASALGQPRLLGALVMGLLLGPAVLGQVAPEVDARLRDANLAERTALRTYLNDREIMREQMVATGITPEAIDLFDDHTVQTVPRYQQRVAEVAERQAAARHWLAMLAAGLFVIGGGGVMHGRRWSTNAVDGVVVAIGPIVLAAGLAIGAVTLLSMWAGGDGGSNAEDSSGAASFWLACAAWAVLAISAALPIHLKRSGDETTPSDAADVHHATASVLLIVAWVGAAALMVLGDAPMRALYVVGFAAASVALGRAAAMALGSLTEPGATRDALALALALVLAAAGAWAVNLPALAALAIGALAAGAATSGDDEPLERAPARRLVDLALPVFATVMAAQLNLGAMSVWAVLVALVLLGDGKSVGAAITAKVLANRPAAAALSVGARMTVGGGMLLVIAWLLHTHEVIDEQVFASVVVAELVLLAMVRPLVGWAERAMPAATDRDGVG